MWIIREVLRTAEEFEDTTVQVGTLVTVPDIPSYARMFKNTYIFSNLIRTIHEHEALDMRSKLRMSDQGSKKQQQASLVFDGHILV